MKLKTLSVLFVLIAAMFVTAQEKKSTNQFMTYATHDMITFQAVSEFDRYQLTVKGADVYFERAIDGMHVPFIDTFDKDGFSLKDGQYTYELRPVLDVDADVRAAMIAARASGDYTEVNEMRAAGRIPQMQAVSGSFRIKDGFFVLPEDEVHIPLAAKDGRDDDATPGSPTGGSDDGGTVDRGDSDSDDGATRDQVFTDDLIVDGSACVGMDCANGENFGFDTLRLKENNLRIKFEDTSTSASFPGNDWQLTANESDNGGLDKFSIDDITGGKTPFTIEAGAPSNSLYVDDAGNIGVGKSTPVVEVHVADGDSPTLRLEQDGSSGFTPQIWDLAGNEANFFVRDVTNGSKLPFKIVPQAPTNSLYVAADGDVGLGTASPSAKLDVTGTSEFNDSMVVSKLMTSTLDWIIDVQNTDTNTEERNLMRLKNNGNCFLKFRNDNEPNPEWDIGMFGSGFWISRTYSGSAEFQLDLNGNLTLLGTVNALSDRDAKHEIRAVEPNDILRRVASLDVSTWKYIDEGEEGVTHMGPMAQDFYAAFGLGVGGRSISYTDVDGVALASIQALNTMVEEKDAQIRTLETRLADQEARLKALEESLKGAGSDESGGR